MSRAGEDKGRPHMAADEDMDPDEEFDSKGTSMRIGPYAARVVAFAALAVALTIMLVLIAASRDTYEVRATFDDVRGLIPGGDVTAGSIVVGSVTDVSINDEGDPEVVMQVSDDYKMYEGAIANIRLSSNVGAVNRVVDLTEGDPSLEELGDGTMLSGAQTDQPVDFDLAVSTLTPDVRDDIRKILIGLDAALLNRGPDFDRMLRHSSVTLNETANLLSEVNTDGEALRTLVGEGQRVVSALASSPGDLGASAEQLAALLQVTGQRQTELAETIQLLGPSMTGARELLERTSESVPNLRTLVAESKPLVAELGPFADQVVPATRAAAPFLDETRKLVEGTPESLRDQRTFLKLAPPVMKRLDPMLDRLGPVSDYLRIFTPETIGFFQNVADAAASYDRNGHMIRTGTLLANVPPSTLNNDDLGPSDCGPGLLEAPYHRTPGVNACQPWDDFEDSLGEPSASSAPVDAASGMEDAP
jgi:phospholipid/cholesterol/gamma-HCH transport system substrate-binding protein